MIMPGKLLDDHNKLRNLQGGKTDGNGNVTEAYHLTKEQSDNLDEVFTNGMVVADAASDGKTYGRKDGAWTEIKAGDGLTDVANDNKLYGRKNKAWSEVSIPAAVTIVNDLTTGGTAKALSAEQGKTLKGLVDGKADGTTVTNLSTTVNNLSTKVTNLQNAQVTIVNDLTTGGTTKALSAEQGKVLNNSIDTKVQNKYDSFGHWGIGYTVNTYNSNGNPTKITFSDSVILTLTYNSDGNPTQAVYKKNSTTLKTCTFAYDSSKRLTSYTVS